MAPFLHFVKNALTTNKISPINGPQIQALLFDFKRYLPGHSVIGDFENWNFNSERITFLGDKESGNEEESAAHEQEIDLSESEAS